MLTVTVHLCNMITN